MIGNRAVVVVAAVLAVAGGTLAPASAGVEHRVETGGFHTDAHGQLSAACGYPVAFTLTGTWNVVGFTDTEGTLVKEIRNYRFEAAISANGVTIRGRLRGPEITEVNEDGSFTVTALGMVSRQVPRGGTVMQHTGRVVTEHDADGGPTGEPVFVSGQAEDPAEVCAAFEGDLP